MTDMVTKKQMEQALALAAVNAVDADDIASWDTAMEALDRAEELGTALTAMEQDND